MSVPVLSLLLAILTVMFSSGREFYEQITYKPNVDVMLGKNYVGAVLLDDDRTLPVTVINNEEGSIVVLGVLRCEGRGEGVHGRFIRVRPGQKALLGEFVVPARSSLTEHFQDILDGLENWPAERKTEIRERNCKVTYWYRGRRYEITKPVIAEDPVDE